MKNKKALMLGLGLMGLLGIATPHAVFADECATFEYNGVCYKTFNKAKNAILETESKAGTIKAMGDVSDLGYYGVPEEIDLTLDLNGHILTHTGYAYQVKGKMTIVDSMGGGEEQSANGYQVLGGQMVLESGRLTSDSYGVGLFDGATMTVNGGEIASRYAAVSGNNTLGDLNIYVNGGKLSSKDTVTIYMPAQVALEITGGEIEKGIFARMGQIKISGGEIRQSEGGSIMTSSQYYTSSGMIPFGSALTVLGGTYSSSNETYGNSLDLQITGGTFTTSVSGVPAVAIYDGGKIAQTMNTEISGGKFYGGPVVNQTLVEAGYEESALVSGYGVINNGAKMAISGGVFSAQPEKALIADGYDVYADDGTYVVEGATKKVELDEINLLVGDTVDVSGYFTDFNPTYSTGSEGITVSGSVVTAVSVGAAELKATYGGLYFPVDSTYTVNVVDAEGLKVEADEGVELDAEVVSGIAERIKEIVAGDGYVAEDGTVTYVSKDGSVAVDIDDVKAAIANGETLRIEMVSKSYDMSQLDEEDMEDAAEILDEGDTLAAAWDIELVIMDAAGNDIGAVYALAKPIELSFEVLEDMREAPEGYSRKFYVIRIHIDPISGPVVDRFEAEFDGTNAKIMNDKFSAFALVYQDEKIIEVPNTGLNTKTTDFAKKEAKLGFAVLGAGMIVLGYGLILQGKQFRFNFRNRK